MSLFRIFCEVLDIFFQNEIRFPPTFIQTVCVTELFTPSIDYYFFLFATRVARIRANYALAGTTQYAKVHGVYFFSIHTFTGIRIFFLKNLSRFCFFQKLNVSYCAWIDCWRCHTRSPPSSVAPPINSQKKHPNTIDKNERRCL